MNSSQASREEVTASPAASGSWRLTIAASCLIALAAVAAYGNTFGGGFIYDDLRSIVENPTIRRLWPLGRVLSPPCAGETVGGRPLLNLSFAVNYALGGLDVRGYHATNLAIHLAAALLLFGILRRTFLTPPLRDRFGKAALPLALACALIWVVHPLHTESVTYVAQRAESLMGLFYLLTLYCVIRGTGTVPFFAANRVISPSSVTGEKGDCPPMRLHFRPLSQREREMLGPRPLFWYVTAVLACLGGMATKEVMVTAPLVVLLYDRTFLAGSFSAALRRRWVLYLGLAATWGLLAYLLFSTRLVFRQEEMGSPSAWQYARTQPGVILYYLRLSIWPGPLCMDYEWPVAGSTGEILPGAVALAILLGVILWGLMRKKAWGFPAAWFLLILAPTSSILPLNQLAQEHRMYLPLAAVVVMAAAGGYDLWGRLLQPAVSGSGAAVVRWMAPWAALAAVLLALGAVTLLRNSDYRSPLAIAKDAVKKRPNSFFAHNILGKALTEAGEIDEAIAHYTAALRLKPDYATAHNNLASALFSKGRVTEAIRHYQQALCLKPSYADAHNNLANVLAVVGRTDEAIEHYRQALRLKPDYLAHYNLGLVLAGLGKIDEAIEHFEEASRLESDDADAHFHLANALAGQGRTDEAIQHYQDVLRLQPNNAKARYRLAGALAKSGSTREAIEHYHRLLQQMPDSIEALNDLAWLLATQQTAAGGDPARAVQLSQRACELGGQENAQCLDTLAAACAAAGRFEDAVSVAQKAVRLAEAAGQQPLAKVIQARLELYRAGRPYRQRQDVRP